MRREDLNALVRKHIERTVSSAPQKALVTLENEVGELLALGMVTLRQKLSGMEEDKLVSRVVEIWGFFWDQILTYIEGVSHASASRRLRFSDNPNCCS
jgi:hypothetical protein